MKKKPFSIGLILIVLLGLSACPNLTTETKKSDAAIAETEQSALALTFPSGETAAGLKGNLELPTAGLEGATIAWASDKPAVISASGVVARPAFDAGSQTVVLTATITVGVETKTKTFTVTVLPFDPTDAQAIAAAKAVLAIAFSGSDSAGFVTSKISLPTTGLWGTTIAWHSDAPGSINDAGVVVNLESDVVVTLTATIGHGTESDTKVFTLTVKAIGTADITINLPSAPSATALVFKDSGDAAITSFTLYTDSTVTVTSSFAATAYAWYTDLGEVPVSSTSSCTVAGNAFGLGIHTLVLDAVAGGKSYSGSILFTVLSR
jgi:hypothetical protein